MLPNAGYIAETSCRPSDDCTLCKEGLRRILEVNVGPAGKTVRMLHRKDDSFIPCEDQVVVKLSWGGKPRE